MAFSIYIAAVVLALVVLPATDGQRIPLSVQTAGNVAKASRSNTGEGSS